MSIEIVNPHHPRGPFRAAIFDFDGTLSLLRRNWQDVMIPMMVDELQATGTTETREELFLRGKPGGEETWKRDHLSSLSSWLLYLLGSRVRKVWHADC